MTSTQSTKDELLSLLTQKVRILTEGQIARELFTHCKRPVRAAKSCIRSLEKQGFVATRCAMSPPELSLASPVLQFTPGDDLPDFDRVSWQLQSRWKEPPESKRIVFATRKAKLELGGAARGRAPRAKEITHDLHVAEVFFRLRREKPEWALAWVPEDALRESGRTGDIPDAVICLSEKEVIIDFGGSYAAEKLRRMHANFCRTRYQIW